MKKLIFVVFFLVSLSFAAAAQSYTIQQYLSIRSANSPAFSPDGKRLAYLTNVTGTSQIWTIDLPKGTPKQITNYEDNVSFVSWSPAGNGLVFGRARGGNENTQFYWMSNDGSQTKELTAMPTVRHNFGGWANDGKSIFYSSNDRNPNYFDIYQLEFRQSGNADLVESLIYKQDGSNSVGAVSDDGKKIIISRAGTELSLDNNLYLLDTETNKTDKTTLLTPHEGASQYGGVNFVADGILYAHNDGREFYSLARMRVSDDDWSAANRETKILDNSNWDVGGVEVSRDGGRMAYTINRDGFSELYVRKIETGGKPPITTVAKAAEMVKLPGEGIAGGLTFSPANDKLAFTFSSSKFNGDIWIYDLNSKTLTQATKSDRAGIPQTAFVEPRLIKFKSFDGRDIPAWYYEPPGAARRGPPSGARPGETPARPVAMGTRGDRRPPLERVAVTPATAPSAGGLPVIVSVHGGPEGQERPGFNPLYQYYLSRGYAILAPNVRGSTGYGKTFTHLDDVKKREDSVKDLAYAVQWLKASGGADARRIAVMGGSYGGYMTLAAITLYPDLWAAAVSTVGIANWESFLKNTSGYRRRQREVEYGRLDRDIDFLRSISPLAKADRIVAPLFVIQGKNDPRVPYTESEQIVNAIKGRAGIVEYKLYDDEGHGISKLKNRLDLYPLVANFLDRHLK